MSEELTGVLTADPPRFVEADVPALARETFGFDGTPIKLVFRAHSGKRQGLSKPTKEKIKRG